MKRQFANASCGPEPCSGRCMRKRVGTCSTKTDTDPPLAHRQFPGCVATRGTSHPLVLRENALHEWRPGARDNDEPPGARKEVIPLDDAWPRARQCSI